MKLAAVVLVLSALVGLEYFHERASHAEPGARMCIDPERQQESLRDALVQHLRAH